MTTVTVGSFQDHWWHSCWPVLGISMVCGSLCNQRWARIHISLGHGRHIFSEPSVFFFEWICCARWVNWIHNSIVAKHLVNQRCCSNEAASSNKAIFLMCCSTAVIEVTYALLKERRRTPVNTPVSTPVNTSVSIPVRTQRSPTLPETSLSLAEWSYRYVDMYMFMHVYVYICMYVFMYICMYVCMYIFMNLWIYVYEYIYIYIY